MKALIKRYPLTTLLTLLIWTVCLIPVPETPLSEVSMIDKWTHLVMFGSLAVVMWIEHARRESQNTLTIKSSDREVYNHVETGKDIYRHEPTESDIYNNVETENNIYHQKASGKETTRHAHWRPLLHFLMLSFLYAWLMGGLVELAQRYLTFGMRSGEWLDFAADGLGALLGQPIGLLLAAYIKKGSKEK